MFFIGIFGIDERKKDIKLVQNLVCKACGNMTTYKLVKVNKVFHIFFIPIFKWDKRYFLISRCCNSIFGIPNNLGENLENNEDIDIKDEDLQQINSYGNANEKICGNCNNVVQSNFRYCPHCGNKMD
ncbi:zinc ribbon domain-containing protein [Clostridium cochlearium]|uniref:zinc ribbon domain-containing protein n=1 Tax=Clostridium cochlearium TaxID=1494 RepID=UPI0022E0D22D|nr:zinc ribbon domain-containing protein [Clostridium cochlearium]